MSSGSQRPAPASTFYRVTEGQLGTLQKAEPPIQSPEKLVIPAVWRQSNPTSMDPTAGADEAPKLYAALQTINERLDTRISGHMDRRSLRPTYYKAQILLRGGQKAAKIIHGEDSARKRKPCHPQKQMDGLPTGSG